MQRPDEALRLRAENAALRDTVRTLETMIATLQATITTLEGTIASLRSEMVAQRAALDDQKGALEKTVEALQALQRRFLGPKPERMPTPTDEIKEKNGEKADPAETKAKRRERAEKRSNVETRVVPHRVPDAQRTCPHCGSRNLKLVGEGRHTPLWQYEPGHFICEDHVQETLACPCGDYIVTAPGPIKPFENGRYGASFVAHLIVAKCLDAIPHHRIEKMFERLGVPMPRSTMTDLFHHAAESLAPLVARLFVLIAAAPVVLADETSIKIQDREKRGFLWTFSTPDIVAFKFSTDRSGETPRKVLGGTRGVLLVDAYTGYNDVTDVDGRERAGCLAHARRKVYEARDAIPDAKRGLEIIRDVYEVEREASRGGFVGTAAHLDLRQEKSRPLMASFHRWLLEQEGLHPPKSKPGKAIRYALKNWAALTVFLGNALVPVDNNRSERSLRAAALGRRNFLFVGNEQAGQNLAGLYSLVASCVASDVNPEEYLADVLLRVHTHPASRIEELLPHLWSRPP